MHYWNVTRGKKKKRKKKVGGEGNKANNLAQKWIKELSEALGKNYFHLSLGFQINMQS